MCFETIIPFLRVFAMFALAEHSATRQPAAPMDAQSYNGLVHLEYTAETFFPALIEAMQTEMYAAQEAEGFTSCILEGSDQDQMLQALRSRMEAILAARKN